jgi:hypothetical protein
VIATQKVSEKFPENGMDNKKGVKGYAPWAAPLWGREGVTLPASPSRLKK